MIHVKGTVNRRTGMGVLGGWEGEEGGREGWGFFLQGGEGGGGGGGFGGGGLLTLGGDKRGGENKK